MLKKKLLDDLLRISLGKHNCSKDVRSYGSLKEPSHKATPLVLNATLGFRPSAF